MPSLKLRIPGALGYPLDARLDLPENQTTAFGIMAHCFTCTKETLTTARVCRGLSRLGYAMLRIDFTGLGNSEGDFADTNFTSMVEDILLADEFLAESYQAARFLIGHSMGGTASLVASLQLPQVHSVVTIASPSKPEHVLHHFGPVLEQLEAGLDASIHVAGQPYPVRPQFLTDVKSIDMPRKMQTFDRQLLVLRAGHDALVDAIDADEIAAYSSNSQIVDFAEADHLFTDRAISEEMIGVIGNWLTSNI